MKFKFPVLLAFCYFLFTTVLVKAQTAHKKFEILGTINGMNKGKAYLTQNLAGNKQLVDSAKIIKGKFSFKGQLKDGAFCYLTLSNQEGVLGFFLENSIVTITADKNAIGSAVVSGSRLNKQYEYWLKTWEIFHNKAGEGYALLKSGKKDSTGEVTMASDPVTRLAFDKAFKDLDLMLDSGVHAFIKKYPSSPVPAYVICDRYIAYNKLEDVKNSFALLNNQARNSSYGKSITEFLKIVAKTAIGAKPDFAIADTAGKILKLSSLRGKYVLVDFWASWCAPCRRENPNVVKAYHKYHDKGFEIVGVSLDTKKDAWLKAIEKDGLVWNHVSEMEGWKSKIVQELGIKVVPTSFLLDKKGKIIATDLRGDLLWEKLGELLN
jgi:thiol-disulfide isomerase/thioredoxin